MVTRLQRDLSRTAVCQGCVRVCVLAPARVRVSLPKSTQPIARLQYVTSTCRGGLILLVFTSGMTPFAFSLLLLRDTARTLERRERNIGNGFSRCVPFASMHGNRREGARAAS